MKTKGEVKGRDEKAKERKKKKAIGLDDGKNKKLEV